MHTSLTYSTNLLYQPYHTLSEGLKWHPIIFNFTRKPSLLTVSSQIFGPNTLYTRILSYQFTCGHSHFIVFSPLQYSFTISPGACILFISSEFSFFNFSITSLVHPWLYGFVLPNHPNPPNQNHSYCHRFFIITSIQQHGKIALSICF